MHGYNYASPDRSGSSSSSASHSLNNSPSHVHTPLSPTSSRFMSHHSQRLLQSTRGSNGGVSTRTALRRTRSIVVLGFSMVGKTALCVRCVNERFEDAYEPTYENSFVKVFVHRGQEVECTIKDTQGVGEQEIFRNEYGLGVHGYVLVYSITSQRSFDIVQSINQKLINLMGTRHVPRVLVGNKLDLANGGGAVRQVSTEAGQALADQWGCAFMECSAKSDVNCNQAFHALLDEIDAQNEPDGTRKHDMQRCWRSICCCCFPRFGGGGAHGVSGATDDLEARLSPRSAAQLAVATDRTTLLCKLSAWCTLILALCGLVGALLIGVVMHSALSEWQELLSYTLFGFSLLVWLVAMLCLYALRSSSIDLLHVCAVSLGILLVGEVAVTAVLINNIALVTQHTLGVLIVAIPTWGVQGVACWATARLAHLMGAAGTASSPLLSDFHSTYHSLYE